MTSEGMLAYSLTLLVCGVFLGLAIGYTWAYHTWR